MRTRVPLVGLTFTPHKATIGRFDKRNDVHISNIKTTRTGLAVSRSVFSLPREAHTNPLRRGMTPRAMEERRTASRPPRSKTDCQPAQPAICQFGRTAAWGRAHRLRTPILTAPASKQLQTAASRHTLREQ
jgi:hypothetical protein